MDDRESEYRKLAVRLESLEARLSAIEYTLGNTDERFNPSLTGRTSTEGVSELIPADDEERGLESQIGRVGLAWLGSIVLLFAIVFFFEYLGKFDGKFMSFVLGYCSVAAVFSISYYLKRSGPQLPVMFNVIGHIALFYITLRLYFFSTDPFLANKPVAIFLLLIVISVQSFIAVKNKSQVYGILSLVFTLFTAIICNSTHISLPLVVIASAGSMFYFYRYDWRTIFSATVFLSYVVFFLWLFSDPVMGNTFQVISDQNYGFIYLFLNAGIFCLLPLLRKNDGSLDTFITTGIIINGLLFTFHLALITITFFPGNYVGLYAIITISCLSYSVLLKKISDWNFASAFFALYGFMAMSISLYGMVGLPVVYLLLSVQSLIVVAMALWFSNRLMIVMNSLLFLTILSAYLFMSDSNHWVNFSFAFVPLISARVINWQKERVNIRTEYIRNLYLIEGFFMVMYAFYHAVPGQFVALSWTGAALLYFLLSFVLRNVKYRYMALGTMICAAIYLFVVDLARIEIIYRVLALLFLAIVSIGISIYYTGRSKNKSGEHGQSSAG